MINKVAYVNKILNALPDEKVKDSIREKWLLRINETTEDVLFVNDIEDELGSNGYIANRCNDGYCAECCLNKWCNHYRDCEQKKSEEAEGYTYADFFCGSGGLSLGFSQEQFRVGVANDIQQCCIDTFSLNHPDVPAKHIIAGDINDVIRNIEKSCRYKNIDVVIGGPPCQGFSMANRQRLIDDPRNHLYKSYVAVIDKLQPKWIVMENVRGILNVLDQIKEDFQKIGYSVDAHILNAVDYGVPQNRERVIFIGNRLGKDNEKVFENMKRMGEAMPKTLLIDAISDLPVLEAKKIPNRTELDDDLSGYLVRMMSKQGTNEYVKRINVGSSNQLLTNHKARYNNSRDIEIFSRLFQGDNSSDPKIEDIMPYKRREKIFKDKYFKLEYDKPCKTITAHMKFDCNMYIHPTQARGLTPREAARIQSYPDDYFFTGPLTKTYMQVGNSVPPLLANIIAKAIRKALEEN